MNQKQKRTLLVLLALLAALVAVLLIVKAVNRRSAAADAASSATAAQSAVTDASAQYTALTYSNGTATLSFDADKDGTWRWTDDPDFPLDNDYLTKLVNTITSLVPQQTITKGDTLAAYGLDSPSATLTATDSAGTQTVFALGSEVAGGSGSYYMMMNGDDSAIYVIESTLHDELSKGIYDMMKLPQLPILAEDQIVSVSVKGTAETTLTSKVTAAADSSAASSAGTASSVTWTSGGKDVTGSESVTSLISELSALTVTACQDYKPSAKAVTLCGFDKPTAVLTVTYTDDSGEEQTLTLTVGGATADGSGEYVRVSGDTTIYSMGSDSLGALLSVAKSGIAS